MRSLAFALYVLCLLCHPASGRADYERVQHLGEIEARLILETTPSAAISGDQTPVRLSGELLSLEITGPANQEIAVAEPIVQAKNWQISKTKPDESSLLPDGRRRWRGQYRLEPDRPGPATLQFGALTVRTAGAPQTVAWPALPVTVVTSIQRVSPDELIEDVRLEPFEDLEIGKFYLPGWVGAALLALGFLSLGYIRLRRARWLRQEEPAPWIRRHIGALRAQNQGTPEQIARFYSELADLLRFYIERRFAVPAPTRTTREFLGDLQQNASLDMNQRELLERFLARCELVKFAREAPTLADCDAAVELVLRFVEKSG